MLYAGLCQFKFRVFYITLCVLHYVLLSASMIGTQHVDNTDKPYWSKAHTWAIVAMPVHSMWASGVLLHRSPVASHSKFNYIAGLCNTLISSTCLIAVKVAGGPHDDTASGHSVSWGDSKLRNASVKGPVSGSKPVFLCGTA